jgi:hypothetical protein
MMSKNKLLAGLICLSAIVATGCATKTSTGTSTGTSCGTSTASSAVVSTSVTKTSGSAASLTPVTKDSTATTGWSFDSTNNVYYRLGIKEGTAIVNSTYETMAILIPGAYFTGTKDSDGTYSCVVNATGKVGNYTALTAPIVMPVNTPGYAGQASMTTYSYSSAPTNPSTNVTEDRSGMPGGGMGGSSSFSSYLTAGMIYVLPGMRGKDVAAGEAPWGVTDLKAAIRTYRYSAASLPGDET